MLQSFFNLLYEQGDKQEDEEKPKNTIFNRLIKDIDAYRGENVLGSFAQEFAEARANLNKE